MRENRLSGSEGGGAVTLSLPLSIITLSSYFLDTTLDLAQHPGDPSP